MAGRTKSRFSSKTQEQQFNNGVFKPIELALLNDDELKHLGETDNP